MAELTNGDSQEPSVISVDPNEHGLFEIESLCMNCHENGMTRILPIKIPYFKQVLLESFSCEHCGLQNNTVKNAGEIQEKGSKYTFRIEETKDFQRQIVRGDNGIFRIETLELEMPAAPGQLTNLEGLVSKVKTDLESDQPERKTANPELYTALQAIIDKMTAMLSGEAFPIVVSLDDISGNSFIEPSPEDHGAKYHRHDYLRNHEQNLKLGLATDESETNSERDAMEGVNMVDDEVYELHTECPACTKGCTVNMKKVTIPHFKEVIILATVCDECGYRTSDVKTGGAIPEKGERTTLEVKTLEDLSRDILKSETCALKSVELGLEVQPGTLGGRFTTVEGLLTQVKDQLHGQIFDVDTSGLAQGDSMSADVRSKWQGFFDQLDKAIKAEITFTITLEDPLANSFVQPNADSWEQDPQIKKEFYTRTEEEMEELGLNDMKTEGYEKDSNDEQDTDDMPALES